MIDMLMCVKWTREELEAIEKVDWWCHLSFEWINKFCKLNLNWFVYLSNKKKCSIFLGCGFLYIWMIPNDYVPISRYL